MVPASLKTVSQVILQLFALLTIFDKKSDNHCAPFYVDVHSFGTVIKLLMTLLHILSFLDK